MTHRFHLVKIGACFCVPCKTIKTYMDEVVQLCAKHQCAVEEVEYSDDIVDKYNLVKIPLWVLYRLEGYEEESGQREEISRLQSSKRELVWPWLVEHITSV